MEQIQPFLFLLRLCPELLGLFNSSFGALVLTQVCVPDTPEAGGAGGAQGLGGSVPCGSSSFKEWWSQNILRCPGLCPRPRAEPPALPWLGEELENTEQLVPSGSGMTKALLCEAASEQPASPVCVTALLLLHNWLVIHSSPAVVLQFLLLSCPCTAQEEAAGSCWLSLYTPLVLIW